jgi:hypothetical protein
MVSQTISGYFAAHLLIRTWLFSIPAKAFRAHSNAALPSGRVPSAQCDSEFDGGEAVRRYQFRTIVPSGIEGVLQALQL